MKIKVTTLRQWTEPNGTTHEPGDIVDIDTTIPGMDFDDHLLAQKVVELVKFSVTSDGENNIIDMTHKGRKKSDPVIEEGE